MNNMSDPFGFPTNDLANLVRNIDNVLKNDDKYSAKSDSTFDRDIPKLSIPTSIKNPSPVRIKSTFVNTATPYVIPQIGQSNHINLSESFVNKYNNVGNKRSLDSILKDISKINMELDTISGGATPYGSHRHYSPAKKENMAINYTKPSYPTYNMGPSSTPYFTQNTYK